jgi:hypothetical protein
LSTILNKVLGCYEKRLREVYRGITAEETGDEGE